MVKEHRCPVDPKTDARVGLFTISAHVECRNMRFKLGNDHSDLHTRSRLRLHVLVLSAIFFALALVQTTSSEKRAFVVTARIFLRYTKTVLSFKRVGNSRETGTPMLSRS